MPSMMCSTPILRYAAATSQPPWRTGIVARGAPGVSLPTHSPPSMNSIRTSPSVMVLARPSIRTSWPASGSIADRRHVCTMALSVIRETPGVATHRRLEEYIEGAGCIFPQFKIRRADFMSEGLAGREQASEEEQKPNHRSKMPEALGETLAHCVFASGDDAGSSGLMLSSMTTPYFSRNLPRYCAFVWASR